MDKATPPSGSAALGHTNPPSGSAALRHTNPPSLKIAVTGASGFIAGGIIPALAGAGHAVVALSRGLGSGPDDGSGPAPGGGPGRWVQVPRYDDRAAMEQALAGIDMVVHLADNPDRDQARGALAGVAILQALLAGMAARGGGAGPGAAGPGRLVLTSSVYARLAPDSGGYGHAKAAMEQALATAPEVTGGAVTPVILRLPPVYGPRGKGGFAMLAKLAGKGLPLPLGRARAKRAYLARDNLSDLIVAMAGTGPEAWAAAAGQIFEPSDNQPIATADLVRALARAQGKTARLLPVPLGLLRALGRITGKAETVSGAIAPLETTGNTRLTELFGWSPTQTLPGSLTFLTPTEPCHRTA